MKKKEEKKKGRKSMVPTMVFLFTFVK